MNKKQWSVLGIGLGIISLIMFFESNYGCMLFESRDSMRTCSNVYNLTANVLGILGFLFLICGQLEKEK